MKDFINWLRNNDKIGKVVIWLFIITIGLIIINTALTSLGLPHYQITEKNIQQINSKEVYDTLVNCIICILNFYTMVLLVFRVSQAKSIFKWSILYMVINWIITDFIGYVFAQIYIILYVVVFCYLYSNKNKKYILYGLLSWIVNVIVQGITYSYKLNFIDVSKLNMITKFIISIDFFIIMIIIILLKEVYIKKRGEDNESIRRPIMRSMVRPIQKRSNNIQKTSTKSHKSKKVTKN